MTISTTAIVPGDCGDDLEAKRERARRRLGASHPRCGVTACPEDDPLALTGVHPKILCAEHRAAAQDRSQIEGHHLGGQHNADLTVAVPANDHGCLSALQESWPLQTLRNPEGSPLLRMAALIRGWLDVLRLILERGVGWIPESLEWLDAALASQLGPKWWQTIELGDEGARRIAGAQA